MGKVAEKKLYRVNEPIRVRKVPYRKINETISVLDSNNITYSSVFDGRKATRHCF